MLSRNEILSRFSGVGSSTDSGWFSFCCPCHPDKHSSGSGIIDVVTGLGCHCHTCKAKTKEIIAALGLSSRDVWPLGGKNRNYDPRKPRLFEPKEDRHLPIEERLRIIEELHARAVWYSERPDCEENPVVSLENLLSTNWAAMLATSHLGICEPVMNDRGEMIDPPFALNVEKDGDYGKIGGIRRFPKWAVELFFKGTKFEGKDKINFPKMPRGLTYADDWDKFPGPLFAAEGASDPGILYDGDKCTFGRPGVRGGGNFIPEFTLRAAHQDRKIVYVVENDAKDGQWPGMDGSRAMAEMNAKAIGYDIELRIVPGGAKDTRQFISSRCDFRDRASRKAAADEFEAQIMSGEAIILSPPRPVPTGGEIETLSKKPDICPNHVPEITQTTKIDPESSFTLSKKPDISVLPPHISILDQDSDDSDNPQMSGFFPTERTWIGNQINPDAEPLPPEINPFFNRKGYCPKGIAILLRGRDRMYGRCACIKKGCGDIGKCKPCACRARAQKYDDCCSKFAIPLGAGGPCYYRQLSRDEVPAAQKAITRANCARVDVKLNNGDTIIFAMPKTEKGELLPHKVPRRFTLCERPYSMLQAAIQEFDTTTSTPVSSSNNWEYRKPKKAPQWEQEAIGNAAYARTVWCMEEDLLLEHGKLRGPNLELSASGVFPPDWTPEKITNAFKWWAIGRRVPQDGHAPQIPDFAEFCNPKARKSA